jgi:hypothetical protein
MATDVRISQAPLEVVYAADNQPPVRISQLPLEIVYSPPPPETRLTQLPVEVVLGNDTLPPVRLSQLPVEVVYSRPASGGHGYYRQHALFQHSSGVRGSLLITKGFAKNLPDRGKIQLARSIIPSTRVRGVVTTTGARTFMSTSGSTGEDGYFLHVDGIAAFEFTTGVVASTTTMHAPTLADVIDAATIGSGAVVFTPTETQNVDLSTIGPTSTVSGPIVYFDPQAWISRAARHTVGSVDAAPQAVVSRAARHVVGTSPTHGEARVTRVVRHVMGPPKEALFQNADNFGPLSWIEITIRSA